MKRLLFILLLAAGTAHGQINNPVTAGSLGLGWSALTNAQSTLYSGQATQLLGYAPEIAGGSTNLTGFNVLGYTNTNGLVIPANILIGEDQTVGGPRNARNVTVNGAVTIQYPYSSPSTIYANNSIAATDASTYTNTLVTWSSNAATFATNVTVNGTLIVSNTATFATNVSIRALTSVQTNSSGPTSFSLALPDNGNVIRVTNSSLIRNFSNGRLGAFYYLINQSIGTIEIQNTNGITVQGGRSLTLAANEVATLVATGPTNVSVAGRGDLTDVALGGTLNTAPSQTNAASASSLMTRQLSDDRYLGEFWHAWRMSAYNTTNIPVAVFKTAPCVLYTNGQSAFYVEAFLDPSIYAGKTVRVLAYCRVDSTNGGNVQGVGRISYLTNNAGGSDPNFPLTIGGQTHGVIGVFTNANTDVFPVATSTNQYLIFTSNVGTISNNATMIIASFGFNRATNISTFTNNLYMQGVQVVVE